MSVEHPSYNFEVCDKCRRANKHFTVEIDVLCDICDKRYREYKEMISLPSRAVTYTGKDKDQVTDICKIMQDHAQRLQGLESRIADSVENLKSMLLIKKIYENDYNRLYMTNCSKGKLLYRLGIIGGRIDN